MPALFDDEILSLYAGDVSLHLLTSGQSHLVIGEADYVIVPEDRFMPVRAAIELASGSTSDTARMQFDQVENSTMLSGIPAYVTFELNRTPSFTAKRRDFEKVARLLLAKTGMTFHGRWRHPGEFIGEVILGPNDRAQLNVAILPRKD